MKNILKSIGEWVIGIIGAIALCVFVLIQAILTPYYYIRYKYSAYYKASKKPYEFFMNFDFLKLYNQLILKNTGYEYHQNSDCEYFTKDGSVLFYYNFTATNISFYIENGEWYVEDFSKDYEERYVENTLLGEYIAKMSELVKHEHKSLSLKIIPDNYTFSDDEIDKAKESCYFYFIES